MERRGEGGKEREREANSRQATGNRWLSALLKSNRLKTLSRLSAHAGFAPNEGNLFYALHVSLSPTLVRVTSNGRFYVAHKVSHNSLLCISVHIYNVVNKFHPNYIHQFPIFLCQHNDIKQLETTLYTFIHASQSHAV